MSAEHADSSWRVRVDPHGFEFDCRDGENVMAAATRAGYMWPTACGGTAHCALCWTRVVDGPEHLDEPSQIEVGLLQTLAARRLHGDSVRLACQAGQVRRVRVRHSRVQPLGSRPSSTYVRSSPRSKSPACEQPTVDADHLPCHLDRQVGRQGGPTCRRRGHATVEVVDLADHIPTIVPTPRGAPSVHLSPV